MTDVLDATRCPGCASIVRPGQEWCTLCHADLRPAPEPVAAVAPETDEAPTPTSPDPLTAPLPELAAPTATGGRHARRTDRGPTTLDGAEPTAAPEASDPRAPSPEAIDAMLAELALQSGSPLGEVSGRLGSRSAKAALAIGLCLGLTVLLLVGSVVLTAVFG